METRKQKNKVFGSLGDFYISFKDGQGVLHKYEISRLLYETFKAFELDDLVDLNVVGRYIELSEI